MSIENVRARLRALELRNSPPAAHMPSVVTFPAEGKMPTAEEIARRFGDARGGCMLVPECGSIEEWGAAAEKEQRELMERMWS
jgi:hypothetical protein